MLCLSSRIYCLVTINYIGKRYGARLAEVVNATRGGGRGEKHFLQASPSNCEISTALPVLFLQKVANNHTWPGLLRDNRDWRIITCIRDTLIIYAVSREYGHHHLSRPQASLPFLARYAWSCGTDALNSRFAPFPRRPTLPVSPRFTGAWGVGRRHFHHNADSSLGPTVSWEIEGECKRRLIREAQEKPLAPRVLVPKRPNFIQAILNPLLFYHSSLKLYKKSL